MAQDGSVAFEPASASGSAPGGEPSFLVETAAGSSPGGQPSFALQTAAGDATGASAADSSPLVAFEPLEASGAGSAGSVSIGAPSFAAATATGSTPPYTDVSFKPMVAAGVGLTGTVAAGAPIFDFAEALGGNLGGSIAAGTAVFQPYLADVRGVQPNTAVGAAQFRRAQVQGTALVGGVATGTPAFADPESLGAGVTPTVAAGDASFERAMPYGRARVVTAETYRTWAMNVGSAALTQYQNYDFNSLADFAGAQWGAGPDGVRRLAGTDDAGEAIAWSFRTGLHDDKKAVLKRLDEVLLSARFDGPMRLRVWTDEDTYFDYNVANHRPDVVHQVRAKLGKGARSRFFRVELSAMGTTAAEVNTIQLPMIPLQRRLG